MGMMQPVSQGGAVFREGHVEAEGFRIRYVEAGQGNPVVMLHGAGGLTLSKVHDELAKKYRVIAFEMPGFGQSPPNSRAQSVKGLAQTMAQAAARLGVDKYALVGTSFGGRVALWQALQSPQQVDLLVLIAPTAVLPEGYPSPEGPSVAPDQVVGARHASPLRFAHPENAPPRSPRLVGANHVLSEVEGVAKEMALVQRIKGASSDTELEERLGEVQTLTLVVFGTADKVVPPAMGRTYRARMPNCHYVLVYDAGHAVADERPEALTNTITDFLDLRETFIVSRRDSRINP
jgi:pimeloyl-ACP methyl ester carboxylesterase